jgi:hypothetical protein
MIRLILLLSIFSLLSPGFIQGQAFIKTTDLFQRQDDNSRTGQLNINQDPAVDSLISRYIINNKKLVNTDGSQGIEGFRIQIYYNSSRAAREESAKAKAEFISKFPDIESYAMSEEPAYFMIRAGDYRTRTEGYKDLVMIRKEFPNAYLVPCIINFPDLIKK